LELCEVSRGSNATIGGDRAIRLTSVCSQDLIDTNPAGMVKKIVAGGNFECVLLHYI
jgi:hypothetical protein